jgi:hypothetical protein
MEDAEMSPSLRLAMVPILALILLAGVWLLWPRAANIQPDPPKPSRPLVESEPDLMARPTPIAPAEVPPDDAPPPPTTGGMIVGRVYRMDGTRVSDAQVRVARVFANTPGVPEPLAGAAIETVSDESGDFSVTGLKAGHYRIDVNAGDESGGEGILLPRDDSVASITVRVWPGNMRIAGIVVGDEGAPVHGARVRLTHQDGEALYLSRRARWDTVTGADGTFLFQALEPGAWQAYATAEGYAPLLSEPIMPGEQDVRLVLTHGGRISGRVLEGDSTVAARDIKLKAVFDRVDRVEAATVTSNAVGQFEFSNLTPGTHTISSADPNIVLLDGSLQVEVPAGRLVSGLEVRIADSASVSGRVYDAATGDGVTGVTVTAGARQASTPVRWFHSGPSDAGGFYEIVGLTTGSYELSPSHLPLGYSRPSHDYHLQMRFETTPGMTVEGKDIPLFPQTLVTGLVLERNGVPAPGADVRAQSTDGFQRQDCRTDDSGRFALAISPDSEIYIRASGFDRRSRLEGPLIVPAAGLSDLRLVMDQPSDAGMAGIVVNGRGEPMRAYVTARPVDMPSTEDGRQHQSGYIDGRFLFTGLAPGDYDIYVGPWSGSFVNETVVATTIHLGAGEMRTGLRLIFDDSTMLKISGHVTNGEGRPIKGVHVHVSTSACLQGDHAVTDAEGVYTVFNSCNGTYLVTAEHPHYGRQYLQDVLAGSTDVNFVLLRRGRVIGQVVDAETGQPLPEYLITDEGRTAVPSFQTVAEIGGYFDLEMDPGWAGIMVRAEGYADQLITINPPLEPGEDRDGIVIELQRTTNKAL